jgi:hypothetical protein
LRKPSKSFEVDISAMRDPDLPFETLVMEACSVLEQTDCSFSIGGFGDDSWPFDVGYDMSTLYEQLPNLLAGVRGNLRTEVDLYSQGIERTLIFQPADDEVLIDCHSRTDWKPDPERETLSRDEFESIFVTLAMDFAASMRLISNEAAERSPFPNWRRGLVTEC